jgi:hypothetical protein
VASDVRSEKPARVDEFRHAHRHLLETAKATSLPARRPLASQLVFLVF